MFLIEAQTVWYYKGTVRTYQLHAMMPAPS